MKKFALTLAAILVLSSVGGAIAQVSANPFTPISPSHSVKENDDGTFTVKIKEWQNYKRDGEWKEIDLRPVKSGGKFIVNKAPFTFEAPLIANGSTKFINDMSYHPVLKEVSDPAISVTRQFSNVDSVAGVVTDEGILYKNALSQIEADVLLQLDSDEARYLVKWDSLPSVCGNPNYEITIPFTSTFDGGIIPRTKDNERLSNKETAVSSLSVESSPKRAISMKQARLWSFGLKDTDENVTIKARWQNDVLYGVKVIPCRSLIGRSFPVYTDDTTTVNPDPDPESTSGDFNYVANDSSWAVTRALTEADSAPSNATQERSLTQATAIDATIERSIFCFDTDVGGGTPSAATLTLVGAGSSWDSASFTLDVVSANPASPTSSVVGDYDDLGTTVFADIDLGAVNASGDNAFSLDANGLAEIDLAGITCYGVRVSSDTDNIQPAQDALDGLEYYMADQTGTASDPELSITYSVSSGSSGGDRPGSIGIPYRHLF